jgi:hypothetical protein
MCNVVLGVFQAHFAIIQNPRKQWDMAPIKSILIGDVNLYNMIKKYESNCNVKPLFDIGSKGSHLKWGLFLKDYCQKKLLRLKMKLFNIILEITLWNVFGLKKATTCTEINILLTQYQTFSKTFLVAMKFVNQYMFQVHVYVNVMNCQVLSNLCVNHQHVKLRLQLSKLFFSSKHEIFLNLLLDKFRFNYYE